MKRIFGLFLLLVAFNVSAIEIDSKLSGIWYNANQSGHGLNVVTMDENTTIVYWYTYHTDGTPMFLITVGANQGNRTTGTTYYNTGMVFGDFNPNDVQESVWGTSTVTFNDCNTASLQYASNAPGYGSGTIPMQRLAGNEGNKCSDSPLHGNYTAAVSEEGEFGYGHAALFENGDMVYFVEGANDAGVGIGQWRMTGTDRFAFDATTYSVFGGTANASGSGTVDEDGLHADYIANGNVGEFIAGARASFQNSLDYSKLAGNYQILDAYEDVVGSAVVLSNGTVSGSTFTGCGFSGELNIPNANFNQAYIDLAVSTCGNTQRIIGAATYDNTDEEIFIGAYDGFTGYIWTLVK